MNTTNNLGPNPKTDKILSWDNPIVEYKCDTDVDKILKYIGAIEHKSEEYIRYDEWRGSYIDSYKIIKEIKDLLKPKYN